MTKISRQAAAVLCAGWLAVAVPEAAAAAPAPAASAAAPPGPCLSGVRRAQVAYQPAPGQRLYVVQYAWVPFTTSAPCLKN
ncbi:hypothetical protein ACFVYA_17155 [Amycolatopsis sp. NPDC058278]|uniref:hypothetical protein n=1 Tax=Amycolatopsis sp. NPDC058278 TaxID=3346417 RepID=UPI0036D9C4C2